MIERRVGELLRRPAGRLPLAPHLVRPGRMSAANDNVPVRSARKRAVALRRIAEAVLVVALIAALLALGACGRRGAPELPASAKNEPRVPLYATEPGGDEVPDRSFVGDKILQ